MSSSSEVTYNRVIAALRSAASQNEADAAPGADPFCRRLADQRTATAEVSPCAQSRGNVVADVQVHALVARHDLAAIAGRQVVP